MGDEIDKKRKSVTEQLDEMQNSGIGAPDEFKEFDKWDNDQDAVKRPLTDEEAEKLRNMTRERIKKHHQKKLG